MSFVDPTVLSFSSGAMKFPLRGCKTKQVGVAGEARPTRHALLSFVGVRHEAHTGPGSHEALQLPSTPETLVASYLSACRGCAHTAVGIRGNSALPKNG